MQGDHTMEEQRLARKQSHSSGTNSMAKEDPAADHPDNKAADPEKAQKDVHHDGEKEEVEEEDVSGLTKLYRRYRPLVLAALATVILGWWISSTILKATRHRWIVQTIWAWFFIL